MSSPAVTPSSALSDCCVLLLSSNEASLVDCNHLSITVAVVVVVVAAVITAVAVPAIVLSTLSTLSTLSNCV
jgi:hypothetical protein